MAKYFLTGLLLAAFFCQGYSITEIWLDERDVDYVSHDYLGTGIGIPKSKFDMLRSCHVIFPNDVMYEAYPNNNIPHRNVFFMSSAEPYTSCGIGFRGVGVEFSGTYQLLSTVEHENDKSVTVTRQKFNLRVTLPDFTL